ncbi:hypothetical protein DRH27_05905 [Candidatus Falkowbacteria bacterium]|nr:MAG: hypothetical protein DRH27_05905 [Candidatus Falkowbacteria bacterium]
MIGLKIQAKTTIGNNALIKNQKDTREAKFLERQQQKALYKIDFDNFEKRYSLTIWPRHHLITPAGLRPVAVEMMAANGAGENVDYALIEVEK